MRFHQALQLEKHKSEQDQLQEEKDKLLNPIKRIVNSQFQSARVFLNNKAWFDPINNSLGRIEIGPKRVEVIAQPVGKKASFSLYGSSAVSNTSLSNLNQ
jgi:hypothetical protein